MLISFSLSVLVYCSSPPLPSSSILNRMKENDSEGVEAGGKRREGGKEKKNEIGVLVCCASLCSERVIRLKMSLVQTVTPRQCGIVGICLAVCVCIDCTQFCRIKKKKL